MGDVRSPVRGATELSPGLAGPPQTRRPPRSASPETVSSARRPFCSTSRSARRPRVRGIAARSGIIPGSPVTAAGECVVFLYTVWLWAKPGSSRRRHPLKEKRRRKAPLYDEPLDRYSGTIAAPARNFEIGRLIEAGNVKDAADLATPAELFALARQMGPDRDPASSGILAELRSMQSASPNELNYAAVSREFGSPKPTLANSYEPELLNLRTFPTLMGYSSRIMAESWESNTLYWAALADEVHLPPSQLNVLIPEWTRRVVERIFASHLEDWPALLKSKCSAQSAPGRKMSPSTWRSPLTWTLPKNSPAKG